MRVPDSRIILFNVAAGILSVAALVAAVRAFLHSPTAVVCSERYAGGTIFSLENGGAALTPAELQARLSGKDVGLGDNVAIALVKGAPSPTAMSVTLAKGSSSPHGPDAVKGGLSFPWEPRMLQGKTTACLSYGVMLPAGFDFGRGGLLPGVRGQAADGSGDGFSVPLTWQRNGHGGVAERLASGGEARMVRAERDPFAWPVGRWVKVEQEVVLNAPGKADGALRVWLDGALVLERKDVTYRRKAHVAISGVEAEVYYGGLDAASAAPRNATIWLSPFQVRWQ